MASPGKLSGHVAIITGASSGIGRVTARRFAEEDAAVALIARRAGAIQQLAAEITATGARAIAVPADVSQCPQVEAAVQEVLNQFGRVDILVNNAGINTKRRSLAEATVEDWTQVIDVDLNGVYYCVRAVLPAMRAQQRGTIINISSRAAKLPSAQPGAAYIAAKAGIVGLSYAINE